MSKVAVKKPMHKLLLEQLVKGKTFSAHQIMDKFEASNPRDLVYKIRGLGVNVVTYTNARTGEKRYRLGNIE